MTLRSVLWRVLLGLSLPLPASAHEYWLSPSTFHAAAGDTVGISAVAGTGHRGELKPFAPTRALRFLMRARRDADLIPLGVNGDLVWARFVVPDAGGALVAYESNFADIELPPRQFDDYLRLEGLDGPLAARARERGATAVHERYARCPKTWIAGGDLARITRPAGLAFELVPVGDPGHGSLVFQALFRGRPLAGALVRAWNRPIDARGRPFDPATRDSISPTTALRTDRNGKVELGNLPAGEWLVSAVHMIRSRDRRLADWESYWASLSFERTAK